MILAALLMTVAAAAPQPQFATAPANLRLGPQGEILAWLVAGPFPNTGALERKGTGFRADYLATEAEATAYQHKEIPRTPFEAEEDKKQVGLRNGSWSLAVADPKSGLDLKGLLRSDKPGIAYCFPLSISAYSFSSAATTELRSG